MKGFKEESSTGMVVARALAVSVIISVAMMLTALGFMYLFSNGVDLPLSTAIVLVVFAISFIASVVLFDRAGGDQISSFIGGAAVALSVTLFVVAVISGVFYIKSAGLYNVGLDLLLTGFAICLIVSLVINRLTLKI